MKFFESNNFKTRSRHIDMIIIQSIGEEINNKFAPEHLEKMGLSSHYYIKPNGEIIYSIEEELSAFHINRSSWRSINNLKENSLGIKLLIEGNHDYNSLKKSTLKKNSFTEKHYSNLIYICHTLMNRYPLITFDRIVDYKDVSISNIQDIGIGAGFDFDFLIESLKQSFINELDFKH